MYDRNNFTIGSGKVYFDPFEAGTLVGLGERYFGNSPTFTPRKAVTFAERYTSIDGRLHRAESVVTTETLSATLTADSIDAKNMAWFFSGVENYFEQAPEKAPSQFISVLRERIYQIGQSLSNPLGVRSVSNVVMYDTNRVRLERTPNYTLDSAAGRITIKDDALDIPPEGALVEITYDSREAKRMILKSGSIALEGALRYEAKNTAGRNINYFFPYVKLVPEGDITLKGDDWQTLSFTVQVLRLSPMHEAIYFDEEPIFVGASPNETQGRAVGTDAEIIAWVNQLHRTINVTLPSIQNF